MAGHSSAQKRVRRVCGAGGGSWWIPSFGRLCGLSMRAAETVLARCREINCFAMTPKSSSRKISRTVFTLMWGTFTEAY